MSWTRFASSIAGVLVTLAMATPAHAQGNSQQNKGKSKSSQSPNQSALPPPASLAGPTGTAPFAWMDNATLMEPGSVWLGISLVRWHGLDASEVSVPVVDASVGLTSRVQLGASVPRVRGSGDPAGPEGGVGTTFFNAKISVLQSEAHGVRVAVAPTLEVLSHAAMQSAPVGQARVQWGLPVSVDLDRDARRYYGSAGYFSPGVWYAGAGAGTQVGDRVGVSISFSRAWSSSSSLDPTIAAPSRNDLSGGVSMDLTSHIGVFGSIGRTIGTSDENGAGTTVGFGMSFSASPAVITK